MIGKLKGIVDELGEDWVILDVQGVGYHVQCSARTLARLPQIGSPFTLSIETYVREDAIKLFGFETAEERDWFRLLQSVQGVGAKVALALLSIMTAADLANAIQFQDKAAINRAPGVGPRLAARILSELKDKPLPAGGLAIVSTTPAKGPASPGNEGAATASSEALSALVNLGYNESQAAQTISGILNAHEQAPPLETLIRESLKELSR